MPSTVADIGVTAYSDTLTQSVEITKSVEELHIAEKDGTYGQGKAFDPTFEVSVSGRGDLSRFDYWQHGDHHRRLGRSFDHHQYFPD